MNIRTFPTYYCKKQKITEEGWEEKSRERGGIKIEVGGRAAALKHVYPPGRDVSSDSAAQPPHRAGYHGGGHSGHLPTDDPPGADPRTVDPHQTPA